MSSMRMGPTWNAPISGHSWLMRMNNPRRSPVKSRKLPSRGSSRMWGICLEGDTSVDMVCHPNTKFPSATTARRGWGPGASEHDAGTRQRHAVPGREVHVRLVIRPWRAQQHHTHGDGPTQQEQEGVTPSDGPALPSGGHKQEVRGE